MSHPSRRDFLGLAAGGMLGLGLSCTSPAPSPAAQPPAGPTRAGSPSPGVAAPAVSRPLDVVKRGNLRGIAFGAAVAKARGYFEEVGIQDDEIIFGSGAEQTQAIAAGQIEVANSSNTAAFFNAVARGLKQAFVFDTWHLERGDKSYMVVLRPDLVGAIKDISDLRGRMNAISTPLRDGGATFQAKKMLETHGLTFDDATWERFGFPDMLTALGNQAVDAAWMIEPFITLGRQRNLLVPWLSLGDYDPGAQIAGVVYSERFMTERTDVARRWGVAHVRGQRDYNDFLKGKNRDVIGPILAAHTGLAPEVVEQVGWTPGHPDGRLNVDSLMDAQRQLLEWGTIQQVLPVDQVVNHQFVDYAVQQLGPYQG